jgi:hypothetical protein
LASFLKKLGKGIKKVGKGVGKIASIAAPVLAMTGVGLPLAAAIGGVGGALQGGKPKQWLKRAALGAGTTALAGGVGKLAAGKGAGFLSKLGGGKGIAGKVGGMAGQVMRGAAGMPAQAAGGAPMGGGMPSLADIGQLGLAGYSMFRGHQDANRARRLEDQMLRQSEQEYALGAPMRDEMRRVAMQPTNTSMLRDTQNPFSQGY